MDGPVFPPACCRQAAPNISSVTDFQDGNRLADDKPVAGEGNGVLESLSERFELFVITVRINRDLLSSFASSPFVGQSFERQRMHQPGDGVGIGGPADQGCLLDLADFIGHLLQILRFNRGICKMSHCGGLVHRKAPTRTIRPEKGPGRGARWIVFAGTS
jgi:hypothetical protein